MPDLFLWPFPFLPLFFSFVFIFLLIVRSATFNNLINPKKRLIEEAKRYHELKKAFDKE